LIFVFVFLKFQKKAKLKEEKRKYAQQLKMELLGCNNYEDVLILWKKKRIYLQSFEHIAEPFHKFELVLNKYQFRPNQTETEKIEVMEAYRKFSRSVEGGVYGV